MYGSEGTSYTAEFWQYSPLLGRRWNIDPVYKDYESPYATFANNPICFVDPNGADTLVFGEDNLYKHTIKADGTNVGKKIGEDGFVFSFVDPVNDAKSIEAGEIKKLFFVKDDVILKDLDRAGVNKEENKGVWDGIWYLKNHSHAGTNDGELDFVVNSEIHGYYMLGEEKIAGGLYSDNLYIVKVGNLYIGQNNYNFGNYLWGASANSLQVSLNLALAAAHANNYLNDKRNQGKKWYEREGDSSDDQLSIILGWMWRKAKKNAEKK